jgi:hypothetical protein
MLRWLGMLVCEQSNRETTLNEHWFVSSKYFSHQCLMPPEEDEICISKNHTKKTKLCMKPAMPPVDEKLEELESKSLKVN